MCNGAHKVMTYVP